MSIVEWRKKIHHDLKDKLTLDHKGLSHYCRSYGFSDFGVEVELIKLQSEDGKKQWVGWHFFKAGTKDRAYAVVTHGLFDHSAYMHPLIHSLLSEGLNVLSPELPGHGLDFKKPLECENFDEYTELNQSALTWTAQRGASVVVEVAHSTGAVGRLNRLLNGEACEHKIVFLNPLVKIQMFKLAKVSYQAFSSILPALPRKKWARGEDPEFLSFRAQDPLQPWIIPKEWVQHYMNWIEKVTDLNVKRSGAQLLVLLGGKDHVVSGQESVKELRSHFNNFESSYHQNLGHQMLYGNEGEVQNVLAEINRWWSAAGPNNS